MINQCIHYEMFRPDLPSFHDRAFTKQTLLRRARKFWKSGTAVNIVKVAVRKGEDFPLSVELIIL